MDAGLASRLAENRLPTLRAMAASSETCPLYVLARLARDVSWTVRAAVARNSAVNETMRELLASDADARVRNAVKASARRLPSN